MPVGKLYLLFISANVANEKEKKKKQVLLPACVSKSAAHRASTHYALFVRSLVFSCFHVFVSCIL
jgi:hypothetical protein